MFDSLHISQVQQNDGSLRQKYSITIRQMRYNVWNKITRAISLHLRERGVRDDL